MQREKRGAFEIFTEVMGWLQIVASPLLISAVIGFILYATNPSETNGMVAICIIAVGLLTGIVWATRVWKNQGTIDFMTTIMRTGEVKSSKMDDLLYRLADKRDLEAVYDLYMDPGSNIYLTYDPMDLQSFEKIYSDLIPTGTLYVAEKDGKVVGSYRLIRKKDRQQHAVYLGGFVVSSAYKGQGIGSRMMQHIKEFVLKNGMTRLELTVATNNASAIGLYKKMGFEIEGTLRESYKVAGNDDFFEEYLMSVIMKKQ